MKRAISVFLYALLGSALVCTVFCLMPLFIFLADHLSETQLGVGMAGLIAVVSGTMRYYYLRSMDKYFEDLHD